MSLDDFFPGSRTPRVEDAPLPGAATLPEPAEGWDDNPQRMNLHGVATEFFTIGALATAMNHRQVVTIRKWERLGYLPKAAYRSGGGRKDRLYTRAQIEGLVALAIEEGIYPRDSRVPIDTTNFPARATQLFLALAGGTP